ncbi:hypothetical protein A33I_15785 [Alkalihalophilus marmarensis DSM 21297]|uniref:Uncharacterized protein n=1 Tax=Alkalihalophilus marmarensis DSM 21297 TaxID=1188261 RepID=U6SNK6_9BACI|nr:hypothetical protein A33I_15785 [Alkalihalophilus marmarensis DSM 21297]
MKLKKQAVNRVMKETVRLSGSFFMSVNMLIKDKFRLDRRKILKNHKNLFKIESLFITM